MTKTIATSTAKWTTTPIELVRNEKGILVARYVKKTFEQRVIERDKKNAECQERINERWKAIERLVERIKNDDKNHS